VLEIHFLRVTHGNCTIIRAHGRMTMIDINTDPLPGRQANSLDYLDAHFPGQTLHRYIQAHLELDHMHGLTELLARRRIKYAWFPLEGDALPHHPDDADAAEWASYDRLLRGRVADTQAVFPVAEQDRALLERFDLEGWSIVMPTRGLVELCQAADGIAPPSYIMAVDYAGVRVLLGGEVRQPLWRRAVRDRSRQLPCTILSASHPVRTPEFGYDARPYAPALDIMRPAQVVLSADPANRAEAEQAYRQRGAEVIWLDQASAVVLRVAADGATHFTVSPAP
jgi:hypothetical protein